MQKVYSIILFFTFCLCSANAEDTIRKKIIASTEIIRVEEGGMDFKARVDTGAETCSIHALDIEVDPSDDSKNQMISFRIVNKAGKSKAVKTRVASVVNIRTSEGSERRYKVPLTLGLGRFKKTVLVTLNDRSRMTYGLLLGRNWLSGDFLVDVDLENTN